MNPAAVTIPAAASVKMFVVMQLRQSPQHA
jgi:hypothetical protein